jgi:DMSO/TMAO reductase YedYZ molybdopterin-dependent catalytic subunit
MALVSRGFKGRRLDAGVEKRVPPGQYLVRDFPVLSAGPTPRSSLESWDLRIEGAVATPRRWTWDEFRALPRQEITRDIHCVTRWSKLDTVWEGVSLDVLLREVGLRGGFVVAECDGGYTTNLPLAAMTNGKAWIVDTFAAAPLAPEHGGPARLLVPDLYLWKSAKWVRRLRVSQEDEPGFWETLGYNNRGDPWLEERYWQG